jgi:membrane protein implicated in regulation of membrane protease activity
MELAYYHWIILALVCGILDLLKLGRLSVAFAFAAGVQAIITYLDPELAWGWQLWSFMMLVAVGSIIYLRRMPLIGERENQARKQEESVQAASLVGTKVYLQKPLYPGGSKLEVRGRFWKVSAKRDFPAGSTVEVTGHHGNTLNIILAEQSSYGSGDNQAFEALALDVYRRDKDIEAEYGAPNYEYWLLFQEAQKSHRKLALVYAYHVLCGLKGMDVAAAKSKLNTYTLALYDTNRAGQFLHLQKNMYSQPRIYNFLYMDGRWTGKDPKKFEEEINDLIAALHTEWAVKFRGGLAPAMVLRAVMMIRKQQMTVAS